MWLASTKVNARVPSRHAPMVSIRITKWISVRKLIPCQPFHPRQQENDHCLRQSLWLLQNLQFSPKNNFADYTMRTCLVTDKQTFFRAISLYILSIISDNCQKGLLSAPSSTKIPHLRMAGLSLGGWGLGAGIYPSYFYRKKKKELKNLPADYLIPHLLIADIQRVTCNLSNCAGILLIMKSLCTSQNVGADWVCKNNATLLLMGPNSNRSITFTLQ